MKAAHRPLPKETKDALHHGVPMFLRQLITLLQYEQSSESSKLASASTGSSRAASPMGQAATIHGRELLDHGFTVDQVVHAYGDVCQSITDLAVERAEPFQVDEFRTLNRCLDDSIAYAVTEFSSQRDVVVSDKQTISLNERMGNLAHELRNLLQTATLTFKALKVGTVGMNGATSAVMDRTLVGLNTLIDRSVSEVRLTPGMAMHSQVFSVAEFIKEVKISASLEADIHKCTFFVSSVDPSLAVDADRHLLSAAVGNLLQNAFKFTKPQTEVILSAYAASDRILIEVADRCGGLPWSDPEKVFVPFVQGGTDKRGLGLGLSISRRSVEANGGALRVRDRPGVGCVFTIDLPRHSIQETSEMRA